MKINLPKNVKLILDKLHKNNYKAYVCGGAVRDSLLGKEPKDWDICTSALPEQTKELFNKTVDTGLQHGTITIILDKEGYEVTTFRTDGDYTDNRKPDNVVFTSCLKDDLSRRDFTINAMVFNEKEGLIDYFGGQQDLENKTIKCVGDANERFQEDALRLLRCIRFSAQLECNIETETFNQIKKNSYLLKNISKERIRDEFCKILTSNIPHLALQVLSDTGCIQYISTNVNKMYGFLQFNINHIYDVWNHTLNTIKLVKNNLINKLVMFYHDIGKPNCFSQDEGKVGHFYGHAKESAKIAKEEMILLKYDNKTIDIVCHIVKYHDYKVEANKVSIKKFINKLGVENFEIWYNCRIADILSQNLKFAQKKLERTFKIKELISEIIENKECFSLKDLNINGDDLINIGFKQGKEIGRVLNILLNKVIEDESLNKKGFLFKIAKRRFYEK
jgi:tRNA nucleotidyltransferase (CCA-adding enzyme)